MGSTLPPSPAVAASSSPVESCSSPSEGDEWSWLRRLLLRALLLRLALAVLLDVTGFSMRLAPDEETYALHGGEIALYWTGATLVRPWRLATHEPHAYFYMNGVSALLFGQSTLPLKLLNALAGTLTCRYFYLIARELFGIAVAQRATLYAAFFPSLVLWSTLNIRDVWVILLIAFISWKSLQVVRGYSHGALLAVVAATYLLAQFRDYLFYVVALPPVMAFLIGRRGHLGRNLVLASLGGLGVVVLMQTGAFGPRAVSRFSLETMSQVREDMATGGSAFEGRVDISTPAKAVAFLPKGLAFFFFSPFPWQITSLLKLFSLPEMVLIYFLTPAVVRGVGFTVRHRLREALQVLLLTALMTVAYALGEGNVGTLYRHRAQTVAFYLIFAAVGRELARIRADARQAAEIA